MPGFQTIEIKAAENVGRALEAMGLVQVDDYAVGVIARSELLHVGELVQELAESAKEPSAEAVRELAERLSGIADAFGEVGF